MGAPLGPSVACEANTRAHRPENNERSEKEAGRGGRGPEGHRWKARSVLSVPLNGKRSPQNEWGPVQES